MKNPDWQHMQRGAPEKMKKWTPKAFEDFAQAEDIYKIKKKRNKGWKRKEYWAKKQGWTAPQRPGAAQEDQQQEGSPQEPPLKRSRTGEKDHEDEAQDQEEEPKSPEELVTYTGNSQEAVEPPAAMEPPPAMAPPTERPTMSESSRPLPAGCISFPKAMPRPVPLYPRDASGLTFHFKDGHQFFLPEQAAQQLYYSIPKAKLQAWGEQYLRRPVPAVVRQTDPIIEILDEEDESKIAPWKRF